MQTRREFLGAVSAAVSAGVFAACGSDDAKRSVSRGGDGGLDGGAADSGADSSADAGDAGSAGNRLEILRQALAASPDHLRAQADALVRAGDAKALFEFVRDSVRVLPPFEALESIETAVRHGTDAVLRSGAGTPRERAELLASLLGRAGHTASVVAADPDGALAASTAPATVFTRAAHAAFDPAPLPASLAATGSVPPPALLDPTGTDADALAAKLEALLPTPDPRLFTLPSFYGMPLVALEEGGKTTYLNTLLADAVYGEGNATNIRPAAAMNAPRSVKVSLGVTRARAPSTVVELVSETYTFAELAGTRLRVSPQTTLPAPLYLRAKPGDLTTFVASFSLFSAAGAHVKTTVGSALTPFGDVAAPPASGGSVNGVPVAKGGDVSKVASVSVSASARGFPVVELEVAPKDASGNVVLGLPASAFAVDEGGDARSAVVRENGGAPRVLVLWDGTGSQPVPTAPLGIAIGNAVLAAMPGATLQVSLLTGSPSAIGYTLTTAAAVGAALAGLSDVQSLVFGGLVAGLASAPTLVLLFTDGDVEPDAGLRARALAATAGCPVVVVGCATGSSVVIPEPLQAIANASGGTYVDGGDLTDPTAATTAIGTVAGRRSSAPYRLAYTAPLDGPTTRHVQVKVGKDGTADYTVPPSPAPSSELVGIHLHVEIDGIAVDRTLAGLPPGAAIADDTALAAAAGDVLGALLGSTWITFEGAAPTLSAWLDDALGAAIGYEPVLAKAATNDVTGAYDALGKAPARPFHSSLLAHAPFRPAASGAVVENRLRAVLHAFRPDRAASRTDLLPTTRFQCVGEPDPAKAFGATLRATLRLALAEQGIAARSTVSLLAGKTLAHVPFGNAADTALPAGVPAARRAAFLELLNRYADTDRLVAADGSSLAFFAVDPSGSALGVLPDGSGGAVEDCKELVEFIKNSMDELLSLVDELEAGCGGTVVAIAAVGEAAAIAVAEAALSFTDPLLDPSIWKLGLTVLCDRAKDFVPDLLPLPEDGLGGLAKDYVSSAVEDTIDDSDLCRAAAPCTAA
ncbi:MAG TPA: hypothetical protein VHE30_12120 [Polyangiaceae bacterium]|nr:hypothetical protein [Polyangiaceae bacterium]